jgi:hypothetical protein
MLFALVHELMHGGMTLLLKANTGDQADDARFPAFLWGIRAKANAIPL